MTIKIPSGNIFENNYTPIKNNTIKTVEIPIKTISTVYEYDTNIYGTKKDIEDYSIDDVEDNVKNKGDGAFITGAGTGRDERLANAIILTKKYITIGSFKILKSMNNEHISKLTSNVNVEVNAKVDFYDNIDCTYNAEVDTFYTTIPNTIIPTNSNVQNSIDIANYEKIVKIADTVDLNNPSPFGYTLSSKLAVTHTNNGENVKFSVLSGGSGAIDIRIFSSEKELQTSQLVQNTPRITDRGDSYSVNSFTVFCGYDVSLCYAWAESQEKSSGVHPRWTTRTAKQVCYKVNPLSIDLNINGDKIRLDMQDDTYKKGNGTDSIRLDGNELIQSSNTHSGTSAVDMFAQKVLTQYANGKETVELQCSINDYFDENGELAISTKQYKENYNTTITFVGMQPFQRKYMITFKGYIEHTAYAIRYQNEQANVEKDKDLNFIVVDENSIFYKVFRENYPIMVTVLCKKLNRLFAIGDEVIPYIYTAYGERPLSTYKNGTPKVFKVVGKKFIDEGIVWQKLTLQEK